MELLQGQPVAPVFLALQFGGERSDILVLVSFSPS